MILDPALKLARRSALASVGAVALTGDKLASTIDRLTARGAQVEQAARARLRLTTADARAELVENQEQIVAESKQRIVATRGIIYQGLNRLIDVLNLPTQHAVEQLNSEVARLSAQIDQIRTQARREARVIEVAQGAIEPLPGYDKLNAEHVVDMLPTLAGQKLLAVRNYEQTHGNRVTVLRAIDKLIEAKAEA